MPSPTISAALDGLPLDPARLTEVVRRATGRGDAEVASVKTRPAAHRVENMTTAALTHVSGTLTDGTPWRVFAKTLRPAWHAPMWADIPPVFHDEVKRELNWHDEPRVYAGPLADDLPGDLRLPELYGHDETDERITLWLEDVGDTTTWDLARYQRTAVHLGRLAGRWPEAHALEHLRGSAVARWRSCSTARSATPTSPPSPTTRCGSPGSSEGDGRAWRPAWGPGPARRGRASACRGVRAAAPRPGPRRRNPRQPA